MTPYGWTDTDANPSHSYLVRAVRELLPAGRILDIGCGNGAASAAFGAAVGVDPDEQGIALAGAAFPRIRFAIDAATPGLLARLDEKPFDSIVSLEVVEHVYDPHDWAQTCFECLRPGGLLICSTPYHGYLKNLALAASNTFDAHWHPLRTGGHIKFWSRATLFELLASAGFKEPGFHGAGRFRGLWKSMIVTAWVPE